METLSGYHFGLNDEQKKILKAREEFAIKYCAEKGWGSNISDITIDQIMEIRSQEGWKTPIK